MAIGNWIELGEASEVPMGQGVRFDIGDEPIAVWNVDGVYYATQDTCTHEETFLTEGDLWGDVIECPLHGAQFDVTNGEVLSLPAVVPLRTYPVKIEDGKLYVEWSAES
jgi:3-phenylpropionate/trans-cinnamate dioxygenase ferredoxin subunit